MNRVLVLVLVLWGCGSVAGTGTDAAVALDAQAGDAAASDAHVADASSADTGPSDAAATDAGAGDAAASDASPDAAPDGSTGGCEDPSSCPAVPPGPCAALGTVTCTDHVCGVSYRAGDAPSQEYGSCLRNVCDDTGAMTRVVDVTNVRDDGNTCDPYTCSSDGVPTLAPAPFGTACAVAGGAAGVCEPSPDPTNPAPRCAECDPTAPGSCGAALTCVSGSCVPTFCTNGTHDPLEADRDCGGPCLPCGSGRGCLSVSDCFSRVCTSDVCAAPTCADGVQNGDETDVDCGGATCGACATGSACLRPEDCAEAVCVPGASGDTCAAASCTDGAQNGDEVGVDCGGSCPPCG